MSKIRVALVDDEQHVIDLMKAQLSTDDRIEVVGVGFDGRDALRLANTLRPDVIVLDITMPNLNGIEAAARITSAFPSIAVIIATGNRGETFMRDSMRAGARDFLDKPIAASTLIEGIISANSKRDPDAPSRGFASVWAYYGAKANTGCSTLAVNTAVDLATLGYHVLLVDLDTTAGDCARYLHQKLPDGPDAFTRLSQLATISAETVRPLVHAAALAVEPPLRIDTLMSPGQFGSLPPRAPAIIRELFDVLITLYDYVIVDLPPGRLFDAHVGVVLDFAERLMVVANAEESSLHAVKAITSTLATSEFAFERLSLVLSGVIAQSQFDARAWLVEHQVPLRELLEMPSDVRACSWSYKLSVPALLSTPKSDYTRFVHDAVDHALNRPPATGAAASIWTRLKLLLHG